MDKKSLNLTVPVELAERFEQLCKEHGHGKQKGVVLSAAILMYLAADPKKQGESLRQIIHADISQSVDRMIERARTDEQRESGQSGTTDN